jgi:hypothetical protein
MADLFGYNRTGNAIGQVASSEYASVNVGGKLALVQSVNVTYTQQIDEVKAVGDSNVYWIPGRPSGTINVSKLVGQGSFFQGWSAGQCGRIDSLSINVGGGVCGFSSGGGGLSFTGAVVETFSLEMSSQAHTVTETASIKVATISR